MLSSLKPLYIPDIAVAAESGILQHPSTFHIIVTNSVTDIEVHHLDFDKNMWIISVDFQFQVSQEVKITHIHIQGTQ
jgi:hypothetical protein